MARESHKPIRMCVVCRSRFYQSQLKRFQVTQGKIAAFTNNGRSFYVCDPCIEQNAKGLKKALLQRCKNLDYNILDYGKMLKEILVYG